MRLVWVCACFLLAAAAGCSAPTYELSDAPKPTEPAVPSARLRGPVDRRLSPPHAEEILLRTKMFVFGEPSRQIQAFNVTFEQPDARRRFLLIAGRGEIAGKLYALCALEVLDSREASQLVRRLNQSQDEVVVYDAGVASERPVADLVRLVTSETLFANIRQFKAP